MIRVLAYIAKTVLLLILIEMLIMLVVAAAYIIITTLEEIFGEEAISEVESERTNLTRS